MIRIVNRLMCDDNLQTTITQTCTTKNVIKAPIDAISPRISNGKKPDMIAQMIPRSFEYMVKS